MNLGEQPLAGAFLKQQDFLIEKFYPLVLMFCKDCFLVQIRNMVSPDILFRKNYFFYSSAIETLVIHFNDFADEIYERFLSGLSKPSIVEIGCNDGVLLKPLSNLGVKAIGVDPATNVVNSIGPSNFTIYNNYFNFEVAQQIREDHGQQDAVLSSYSFAHIDNMHDVMKGVKYLLKNDGVFVFEIYYLGTLIDEMQYDMIYHEHMSYYSLKTLILFLQQYDMEIFDVKFIEKVRSGTTRFYVKNRGKSNHVISNSVDRLMRQEDEKGYDRVETYYNYAQKVKQTKINLIKVLDDLKSAKYRISGYGASGRGTVIMNYCDINDKYVDYVVDDAPAKHGFYTPGTHMPIKSWEYISEIEPPDYIILFAWAFTAEVLNKRNDYREKGGKFIIPLPEVIIV
jgi:methylation protein EvaC